MREYLLMGNQQSIKKVNFEDIQNVLQQNVLQQNGITEKEIRETKILLINTIENNREAQSCIIPTTLHYSEEESVINKYLNITKDIPIIIYGKNANDKSVYEKHQQLTGLGFMNVYIYPGGMFEWMLLQEIYTSEHFKTTNNELNILKFKPKCGMRMQP